MTKLLLQSWGWYSCRNHQEKAEDWKYQTQKNLSPEPLILNTWLHTAWLRQRQQPCSSRSPADMLVSSSISSIISLINTSIKNSVKMPQSYKHQQNSHHDCTFVYLVQQLLLTAVTVCFVLTGLAWLEGCVICANWLASEWHCQGVVVVHWENSTKKMVIVSTHHFPLQYVSTGKFLLTLLQLLCH